MTLWLLALTVLATLVLPPPPRSLRHSEVPYSEFLHAIEGGKVSEVKIGDDALTFRMKDERRDFHTYQPTVEPELIKLMSSKGVTFFKV